jgi:hypothetical protein
MLSKLKNIFRDKNSKEWQDQVEWAKNNVIIDEEFVDEPVIEDIDATEEFYSEPTEPLVSETLTEINLSTADADELRNAILESLPTNEFLLYSPEAVGYPDSAYQVMLYRHILVYTGAASILDYGCGRGDFKIFVTSETGKTIDYVGMDSNFPLIEAGRTVYGDNVDIREMDWSAPHDIVKDWCINIMGLTLRYDLNMKKTNEDILDATIETMLEHANIGVALVLTSDCHEHQEGIIRYNPGELLNKYQKKYNACIVDHSMGDSAFTLVIYKS